MFAMLRTPAVLVIVVTNDSVHSGDFESQLPGFQSSLTYGMSE